MAGPPLTIEDPDILDPGQWEVILAAGYEKTEAGRSYDLPILDVSYGVSENIQVSFVAPRRVNNPDGESSRSDFGIGEIGFKWRFYNEAGRSVAVAPLYEFNLRDGAADRGVVDNVDALVLPLVFQYEWGDWRFNGELGYAWVRSEDDELLYGVGIARAISDRTEVLASIYGAPDTDFNDHGLSMRLGVDHQLAEDFHLLFGIGTGLESDDDKLELDLFLGLQWFW